MSGAAKYAQISHGENVINVLEMYVFSGLDPDLMSIYFKS